MQPLPFSVPFCLLWLPLLLSQPVPRDAFELDFCILSPIPDVFFEVYVVFNPVIRMREDSSSECVRCAEFESFVRKGRQRSQSDDQNAVDFQQPIQSKESFKLIASISEAMI